MEKKKLLILENIEHVDHEISAWVKSFTERYERVGFEYELIILNNLSTRKEEEIIDAIMSADDIACQSTFGSGSFESDGYNQFIHFIKMFTNIALNGKLSSIYVLKNNKLADFLNFEVLEEDKPYLIDFLRYNLLFEIGYNEYDDPNPGEFFHHNIFEFNEFQIKFYEKHGFFWHSRPKYVQHPNDWVCERQPRFERDDKVSGKPKRILSRKERKNFILMMNDDAHRLSENLEDLENHSCFDEEETKELIELKEAQLKIVHKLIKKSF